MPTDSGFRYSLKPHPGIRQGLLHGILHYLMWLRNRPEDDRDWAGVFPCRFGKSDFIRTAALVSQDERLTGPSLVVHPAVTLSRQFLEANRVADWRIRWNIHYSRPFVTLSDFGQDLFPNNEWLGSVHIQAILRRERLIRDFAKRLREKYGLPPSLFLDETHRFTYLNRWGDIPRLWMDEGGIVAALTATGFRHDGDDPVGFTKELKDKEEDFHRSYTRPHIDPKKYWLITEVGTKSYFDLKPDFEIKAKEAWAAGAVGKSSVDWIDVEMREIPGADEEDKLLRLSEVPKSKVPRYLPAVNRDPKVIREFVTKMLRHTKEYRRCDSTAEATWIAYGLNDSPGDADNAHLLAIKEEFLRQDPALKIAVASLKADAATDKDDEKAAKLIARFTDKEKKHFDGICLKQMGGEGLDSDRIRVVGTLDNVRSAVAKIQQWNRGGNIWGSCRHFVIVAIADCINQQIYKQFIESEGGKVEEFELRSSDEEPKDKKDGPDTPLFTILGTAQLGADDSDGLSCTPHGYATAFRLLEELPELIHRKSIPVIAGVAARLGVEPWPDHEQEPLPADVSVETQQVVGLLNEVVRGGARVLFRLAHGRYPQFSEKADRDEFGGQFKPEFIRRVKKAAGVSGSWDQGDPDRIRDVDILRQLLNVGESLIADLVNEIS